MKTQILKLDSPYDVIYAGGICGSPYCHAGDLERE